MNLLPNGLRGVAGAYVVGGCVRDLLLGRTPTDYDIAFLGDAPAYARRLAAAAGGRVVEIGKPSFRIWRVVSARAIIDVAPAAGGSLAEDLRRRDFTINALAINAVTGEIVDVTGGREDLAAGTIRMASDAAFRADPVRLLRAYRFASRLGFTIDPRTEAAIGRDKDLLGQSAGERIRDELFKLLGAAAAHPQVVAMQKAGLLRAVFPELATNAIERELKSLQALELLLNGFPSFAPDLAARLSEEFQEHRQALLKCAVLLQPIAYPRRAGALSRLRLSKRDAARIELLIEPRRLPRESNPGTGVSAAETLRFFRTAGNLAPDFLLQALAADAVDAARPADPPTDARSQTRQMLREYFFQYRPRALSPPPITGKDLIAEFGLRPSPRFKELLDLVDDARLSQERLTRAEALELVRTRLAQRL